MPVFNYPKKEVNVKVVYYGPGLSGKTTNLQKIHDGIKPDFRGKLVSLATQTDRTLFFDFMPMELGSLGGYKIRLHLYTVPGQVHYNATRKLVLKGVDGVVFVADSQKAMSDANIESVLNLEKNLQSYGKSLADLPHVIQANKRDLDDVISMEEVGALLNHHAAVLTEAVASDGDGVMETLTGIVRLVMKGLKDQFAAGLQDIPVPAPDLAAAQSPVKAREEVDGSGTNSLVTDKIDDVVSTSSESEGTPEHDLVSDHSEDEMVDADPESTDIASALDAAEDELESVKVESVEASVDVSAAGPVSETDSVENDEATEDAGDRTEDKGGTPIKVLVPVEGVGTLELAINVSARVLTKGEIKAIEVDAASAALTGTINQSRQDEIEAVKFDAIDETAEVKASVPELESADDATASISAGNEASSFSEDTGNKMVRSEAASEMSNDRTESAPLAEQEIPAPPPAALNDLPPLGETTDQPLGAPLDGQEPDPLNIPDLPQEDKILLDEDMSTEMTETPAADVAREYDPSVPPLDFDFPETVPEDDEQKKKGLFGRFKKK